MVAPEPVFHLSIRSDDLACFTYTANALLGCLVLFVVAPGPALPLDELGDCLGRWIKGGAKNTIVWFRK